MRRKIHKLYPAVALAVLSAEASGQTLYEPFNYTSTTNLSSSTPTGANYNTDGTFWATRGTVNVGVMQTGLGLANYMTGSNPILPTPFGKSAEAHTTGGAEQATVGLGQYFGSAGDLYYSTLIKANSIPSSTGGV